MSENDSKPTQPAKRGRGRPRKTDLDAKKPGGRGKVGRPKGDAAIINEYKARMLSSPKSELILQKILDTALDDEHKNQAACMKMVMDRILPASHFEKDKKQGGISGINISITTADPAASVNVGQDIEDADYEEI